MVCNICWSRSICLLKLGFLVIWHHKGPKNLKKVALKIMDPPNPLLGPPKGPGPPKTGKSHISASRWARNANKKPNYIITRTPSSFKNILRVFLITLPSNFAFGGPKVPHEPSKAQNRTSRLLDELQMKIKSPIISFRGRQVHLQTFWGCIWCPYPLIWLLGAREPSKAAIFACDRFWEKSLFLIIPNNPQMKFWEWYPKMLRNTPLKGIC